jgi:hypothetical protein
MQGKVHCYMLNDYYPQEHQHDDEDPILFGPQAL